MKDLGPLEYFLGIQASHYDHGLHLCQSKYKIDLLHHTKMMGAKPYVAPGVSSTKISWQWGGSATLHLGKGSGSTTFFFVLINIKKPPKLPTVFKLAI